VLSRGKSVRTSQKVRIATETQLLFCATEASQDPIYGACLDGVGFASFWKPLCGGADRGKCQPPKISKTTKLFSKIKIPYISYTFTGKLDLTDVHLPDVYLPDVHPRRRIPRRRASYIYRRAPRGRACHECVPHKRISQACTS
jgi:hypothetical protein